MSSNLKSLTDGQLKGYLAAFRLVDPNTNYKIEAQDYFTLMENLGIEQSVTAEEFADLQYGTDVENQREVSFTDFAELLAGIKNDSSDDLAAAFNVFDHDGNQTVNKEAIVKVLAAFNLSLSDEEMDALFAESDKDKDGNLTLNEFMDIISYADKYIKKHGLPENIA